MPSEQAHIARVEPLGFVEVRLAPLPLPLTPGDKGERLRNPAAIGQELTCLLIVTHRRLEITQATVMVKALGHQGFAEIGLKSERGFGRLPRLFPQGDRGLEI